MTHQNDQKHHVCELPTGHLDENFIYIKKGKAIMTLLKHLFTNVCSFQNSKSAIL
jgi:hypothetical protein